MPRLPRVTGREVLTALRRGGWRIVRQDGSHVRLHHPTRQSKVTVAVHAGDVVKPGTLKGVLDQAGLTVEEFVELL
jgi:predicted RNA binding protein YcfA (HicA-like mRNA interferase family)